MAGRTDHDRERAEGTPLIAGPRKARQHGTGCSLWTRSVLITAALMLLVAALTVAIVLGLPSPRPGASPYTPSPHASYARAAVASDAPECSKIGTETLQRGGSAVDAAITAVLCAGIFNSHSTGIGGGSVWTIYDAPRGQTEKQIEVLNAREAAPGAATFDMYKDKPGATSRGGLAIAVPGEIKAYWAAHKKYGRLPWRELFFPIIKMCEDGFAVTSLTARMIRTFEKNIGQYPFVRRIFTKADGSFYNEGDVMTRPYLARTLRVIAEEGPDAFYNGSLTSDIVQDLKEQGSIITRGDLQAYETAWLRPIKAHIQNGNLSLVSPPLPFGGHTLSFIFNILDGYGISEQMEHQDTSTAALMYHRIAEAFKFAYSAKQSMGDEAGDPDLDLTDLKHKVLSADYGNLIRSKITSNSTHDIDYYKPEYPFSSDAGTSHLSLVSPDGAAVAVTSTVNTLFGSKVFGNRTGIIFNNEMDDFAKPKYYSDGQLIEQSRSNFIKPGKRPLSSMCPSMLFDGKGNLKLVLGGSGGTKIITAVSNVAIHHMWLKKSLSDAVSFPRLHHRLIPNVLNYDEDFPQDILKILLEKGHELKSMSSGSVIQAIARDCEARPTADAKCITAVCDWRKIGVPDGF